MPDYNTQPATDPLTAVIELLREIRDTLTARSALMLDAEGTCALLGQSRSSLYRGVSAGTIPAPVDTPSGPRWRRADLERWCDRLRPRRRRPVETVTAE